MQRTGSDGKSPPGRHLPVDVLRRRQRCFPLAEAGQRVQVVERHRNKGALRSCPAAVVGRRSSPSLQRRPVDVEYLPWSSPARCRHWVRRCDFEIGNVCLGTSYVRLK
jgi:hypothetical protein